jgi:hypothetical protein
VEVVAAAAGIETERSLVTAMLLRLLKKGVAEAVVDDPLVTMETELRLDEKRLQWI